MISPVPNIDLLWEFTEDEGFCQRFPRAAQMFRGLLAGLGDWAGGLEANVFSRRDEELDKELDSQIVEELARELMAMVKEYEN